MGKSVIGGALTSLFYAVIIGFIIYSVVSQAKKKIKMKKLKAGEIPSREIKGKVCEIKYKTGGKNNNGIIVSRYFIAKGTNPTTNEEMEFESGEFPYTDSDLKIRRMGPNQDDINKLLDHARQFIKEGDIVKIHISIENQEVYYIEDITQKAGDAIEKDGDISELIIFSKNTINEIKKNPNLFIKSGFDDVRKILKIFGIVIVILSVGLPTLVMFMQNGDGIKLSMPTLDLGINLNFGGSYIVRIILVLLVAFIIYKVIVGYRGGRKS